MRFLASWWERFPKRETIPALIALLAITGSFGQVRLVLKVLLGPAGWSWD